MHELQRTQQFKITSLFSASRKSPGFEDHHTSALNAAAMPQKDPLKKKKKTRGERQIDPYSSWDLFFFFFLPRPVTLLTYWTSRIGISTQLVHPVLTQAYCITTIPACKVGQNIYLGIICLQVHTALKYPALGKGLDVWGAGIVTFGITLQHLHAIMHLQRISGTSLDFPWYLLPCAVLVREVKLDQFFFFFFPFFLPASTLTPLAAFFYF